MYEMYFNLEVFGRDSTDQGILAEHQIFLCYDQKFEEESHWWQNKFGLVAAPPVRVHLLIRLSFPKPSKDQVLIQLSFSKTSRRDSSFYLTDSALRNHGHRHRRPELVPRPAF